MNVNLPDHLANRLGETVFTGLLFTLPSGKLMVMVPFSDDAEEWLAEELDGPDARDFAKQLDALAQTNAILAAIGEPLN